MLVSQVLAAAQAAVQVGQYVSIWKVLPVIVILLIWARLLTWMDKDSTDAHLPRQPLNAGMIAGFLLGFALFLLLPSFWVALSVLLFFFIVDAGVYLLLRNQKVGLGDLGQQFKDFLKGQRKEKAVEVEEGEIGLMDKNGAVMAAPDPEAPELIGYHALQKILSDPMKRSAERVDIASVEGSTTARYLVDGMPYSGAALSREDAAAAIDYTKQSARMDLNEKRKPQTGNITVLYAGKKREFEIVTAGSTAGEQMQVRVDPRKRHSLHVEELGFTDEQLATVMEVINDPHGIVLVSAPKGQGLTSIVYGILRRHDAFLSHIQTIERDPPQDLEGITQNKMPANAPGAEESKQADWVTSQEPDILAIPEITDARAAQAVVRFTNNEAKLAYVGVRAGSTFDALNVWRKLVGNDKDALRNLRLVISGRLVRKLCMACKVGYTPPPEALRKLNLPTDRELRFFQARDTPLLDPKGNPIACEFCHDVRFLGRTGVFELFGIDDDVRQAVSGGGTVNQLRNLFRKQRRRFLQEEALAKVEAGETSVQEVLRALKEGGAPATSGSSPGVAPAAPSGAGRPKSRPSSV
jgi:type II secretory ATPase GspE/PulE/Tfp pilus assembly ATPase PilB-like protein